MTGVKSRQSLLVVLPNKKVSRPLPPGLLPWNRKVNPGLSRTERSRLVYNLSLSESSDCELDSDLHDFQIETRIIWRAWQWLEACFVPDAVLSPLTDSGSWDTHNKPVDHPHFTDEDSEAWGVDITCRKSHYCLDGWAGLQIWVYPTLKFILPLLLSPIF